LVEMEIPQGGKVQASAPGEVIRAAQTMESALSAIKPVVIGIVGNMMDIAITPAEITVELGLGLSLSSDGILKMLVASEANASFKVSITWNPEQR